VLSPACVFAADNNIEAIKRYEQVFLKLIRRYKYLEKMLAEEMRKVYNYMKQFSDEDRVKLDRMSALWIINGTLAPGVLACIAAEHLVKDNIALDFVLEVFVTIKLEKGVNTVVSMLKKSGLDMKLMDYFPQNKRSQEIFEKAFMEKELGEVVKLQRSQASQEVKKELQKNIADFLADGKAVKEIINEVKDYSLKNCLAEYEVIAILWTTLTASVEWNKKEELVAEQALKHIKNYATLLGAFTDTPRAELTLMLRIQDFCYDNMNFMKVFQKIILLLYKTDVLSEDIILKWYKESHSSKGKSVFLEQMKNFIEWLENAEEESESDENDN